MELDREDIEEILTDDEVSDHVKMQWKLLRLGLKTGATVWIPKGDQKKIETEFDYQEFPKEFAAGIDMPGKYVENIDVVWKEEFQVDAAFEIENSTSIYSGLLRFADLKIIAPNSNYPLFIVAPLERKNKVWDQLRRPSFQKLSLTTRVNYISYEAVNDIDKFFEQTTKGLNVDVMKGRSEQINGI